MFVRVRDFGAGHVASFPAATLGKELFDALDGIVTELEEQTTAQASGSSAARQGTTVRAQARAKLREDLEAISRTARSMSRGTPGIENKFRMPPGNSNDQALINAARAFAADAVSLSAEFIRHELPADFLAVLNNDINAFEVAVNEQNRGTETRVSATAAIDATIERGVETVRRLDAVVRNKFRDDQATLAAWESASHTERAPRSPVTPPPPPTPTP
jgi:hypothetical protein